MKNDKAPLPDHAVFTEGTYAWFHFKMIGKEFTDGMGKTFTKLQVFNENKRSQDYLRMIMDGKIKDLQPVDKTGWKDGILTDRRSFSKSSYGTLIFI